MAYIKNLPSELEGEGLEVKVLKLDDTDFIFIIEDEVFGNEFFAVKKPYHWKKEVSEKICVGIAENESCKILMKREPFEYMGKSSGRLVFLGFKE